MASMSQSQGDRHDGSRSTVPGAVSGNRAKRRATRACDRCKSKKMRCTGKQPCAHCVKVEASCEYNAKYTRGKAPLIQTASEEDKAQYLARLGWRPVPSKLRRESSSRMAHDSTSEEDDHEEIDDLHPSPAQQAVNRSSMYHRSQRILDRPTSYQQKIPIYAYGDPPIPDFKSSFLVFPASEAAELLVTRYFEVVAPANHYLHRGTVLKWLAEILTRKMPGPHPSSNRIIVLLVIASALNHVEVSSSEDDLALSFQYFQAANCELQTESGPVRIESIQARLLACYYLLSLSRINQAWTVFAEVVSQIYAIELHRRAKSERAASEDWIRTECSKRVFWAAYTLDKHLSIMLGTPQYFHDNDIDQELPQLINDEYLSSTSYIIKDDPCNMTATLHMTNIAVILSSIIRKIYSIRPATLKNRLDIASQHHVNLTTLAAAATSFLILDSSRTPNVFRQGILTVKLSLAHVIVVLFRPFLLECLEEEIEVGLKDKHEENVALCMEAALVIAELINTLYNNDDLFEASWFEHLCGYTATVALYVYVIKQSSYSNESSWMPLFKAAASCQAQIKTTAEKDSFSQKCSLVLEQLKSEASSHIEKQRRRRVAESSPGDRTPTPTRNSRTEAKYTENFAAQPAPNPQRAARPPEFLYGAEWQDMSFDQNAPGGGILGSMDWIGIQDSSLVDQIASGGFSSLTSSY